MGHFNSNIDAHVPLYYSEQYSFQNLIWISLTTYILTGLSQIKKLCTAKLLFTIQNGESVCAQNCFRSKYSFPKYMFLKAAI